MTDTHIAYFPATPFSILYVSVHSFPQQLGGWGASLCRISWYQTFVSWCISAPWPLPKGQKCWNAVSFVSDANQTVRTSCRKVIDTGGAASSSHLGTFRIISKSNYFPVGRFVCLSILTHTILSLHGNSVMANQRPPSTLLPWQPGIYYSQHLEWHVLLNFTGVFICRTSALFWADGS